MQPEFIWRGQIPVHSTPPDAAERQPIVLVVTSDADLRAAAARALAGAGYRVLTASHGGHALLACMSAERVDLLAAELSMDDMSGPALATRLRRLCPGLRAIYFAGAGTHECDGVLVRPFTRDDLLVTLARAGAAPAADAISAS
jgi:CheY-like chemotaxis protein